MKPTIEASSTVSISGSATIPTNSWSPGRWGYRALRFLDQAAFVPAYPKRDITISEAASRRIEQRIDLPSVLGRVPLLSVLDSEQVLRLAETGNLHEFPVETVIVGEGDAGASLYIVVAGVLDVSRTDADGGARTIARLQSG